MSPNRPDRFCYDFIQHGGYSVLKDAASSDRSRRDCAPSRCFLESLHLAGMPGRELIAKFAASFWLFPAALRGRHTMQGDFHCGFGQLTIRARQ